MREDYEMLREKLQEMLISITDLCDNGEMLLNSNTIERLRNYFKREKVLQASGTDKFTREDS